MASKPLGKFPASAVFWTLDVYPKRESAEKANTNNGAVVQAMGKIWLFTVEKGQRFHRRAPASRRSDLCR